MATYKLTIQGMHCMNSCVRSVREELSGLKDVSIQDIRVNEATISTDNLPALQPELDAAIREAGFQLVSVQPVA
ncbi:MAG: heavy-metal-associated domain-containing protein [Bacteroidetes bacterium]|nr:heavy-metal-associated domain-containing protein [Bacteroidota bacterium]